MLVTTSPFSAQTAVENGSRPTTPQAHHLHEPSVTCRIVPAIPSASATKQRNYYCNCYCNCDRNCDRNRIRIPIHIHSDSHHHSRSRNRRCQATSTASANAQTNAHADLFPAKPHPSSTHRQSSLPLRRRLPPPKAKANQRLLTAVRVDRIVICCCTGGGRESRCRQLSHRLHSAERWWRRRRRRRDCRRSLPHPSPPCLTPPHPIQLHPFPSHPIPPQPTPPHPPLSHSHPYRFPLHPTPHSLHIPLY